jgi:hypothetical protein
MKTLSASTREKTLMTLLPLKTSDLRSLEKFTKAGLPREMARQKGSKRLRKKKAQKVLLQKWQHSQISEKLSLISRGLISSFQDNIRREYFRRMFMPIETIPKESLGISAEKSL